MKRLYRKFKDKSQEDINKAFFLACESGHLDTVKYLLTSSELPFRADIHYFNDLGFILACANNHLDIIKYLLSSPDLKEHANIHAESNSGFNNACSLGHLDIIKYLLSSSDLKERMDVHAEDDSIFKWACRQNQKEFLNYLIFDYNIVKTESIQNFLDFGYHKDVEFMFQMRDLNEQPLDNNIKKLKL